MTCDSSLHHLRKNGGKMLTTRLCYCHPSPVPLPLGRNKTLISPNSDNCTFYFKTAHALIWVKAKFFSFRCYLLLPNQLRCSRSTYQDYIGSSCYVLLLNMICRHSIYQICNYFCEVSSWILTSYTKLQSAPWGQHHVHSAYCFVPSAGT